jgi:TATA-box binding protein (TBP) (component of TFIID and TFIIIB)
MRENKATMMLFARGNFMCVGARHYNAAIYCVLYLKARLAVAGGYPLIADEYDTMEDRSARALADKTDPASGRPTYEMFDEVEHNRKFAEAQRIYQESIRHSHSNRRGEIVVQPRQRLMEAFSNSAFRDMTRVNVVGTTVFSYDGTSTPMKIDLDLIEYFFSDIVSRTKQFPGLFIRSPALAPIRVAVFDSGRVNVTGGQNDRELENALRYTHALIRMCSEKASRDFHAYYRANNPAVIDDMRRHLSDARRDTQPQKSRKRKARKSSVTIDDLCDDGAGAGDEDLLVVNAVVAGNGDFDDDADLFLSDYEEEDEPAEDVGVLIDEPEDEPRAKRAK